MGVLRAHVSVLLHSSTAKRAIMRLVGSVFHKSLDTVQATFSATSLQGSRFLPRAMPRSSFQPEIQGDWTSLSMSLPAAPAHIASSVWCLQTPPASLASVLGICSGRKICSPLLRLL